MKIFGFFVGKSKRLMALEVIVLVLLASAVGVVSGYESGGGCIAYLDADPDSITADGKSTSIMNFKALCPGKYRFSAVPSIGTIKLEFPQIVPGRPSYATYTAPTTQELGDYKGVTITFYLKDDKDPNVIIESKSVTISLIPNETEYCKDQCRKRALPSDINKENLTGAFDYDENGEIKRDSEGNPICECFCEKSFELRAEGCVACEDICLDMDSRAHYDDKKSKPNKCECYCKGKLLKFVWDSETGKCECVTGAEPKGDECGCKNGWKLSVRRDKCVEEEKEVEEVEEKTPIEEERARIAKKYEKLEKGYLLFSEGKITMYYLRWMSGTIFKPDYGHVGIYIGDFEADKEYTILDEAQLPLKVYHNGKAISLTKVGDIIKQGDWIIGCVVEARGKGIVFNTVDGMENEARRTMGYEPEFAWKTTKPPPDKDEVDKIVKFALEKIELTQQGKAKYMFGQQGSKLGGIEWWDCVSLGIAAYEKVRCFPVPLHLDKWVSVQPQELYDYMGYPKPRSIQRAFNIIVESPVNLHLYDSQDRHVGFTPSGAFERGIPNAYYYLEFEQLPQAIFVQNVNDEYTLVIQAVDSGSFNLKIQDLNVSHSDSLTKVEFLEVSITESTIATVPLGANHKDYRMSIDQDGDGKMDRTLDPMSLEVSPIDTGTADVTGLTFESRSKPTDSNVQIPLTLNGLEDKIGNMDITLRYDPLVLEATAVTKGDLTSDSLFEYNIMAGTILISLADAEGFRGNGSIAYVTFDVIGAADSTSPLQIAALTANRAEDYEVLTVPTNDGVFRVIFISTDERGGFTVSVSDTTGAKGSTVEVPINLEGATEVGSMDIVLTYDADVLSAVDVEAGELGKNALIESNTAREGEVIIALADSSGISGDGAIAIVAFEVIGDVDTTSYLTLEEVLVHNLDLAEIIPNTECGTFLVI